jgi:signal transduction histidine kinase
VSVPGGIRVKLAVTLVAIVAGALAVAYLMVVPRLEQRLVDAKLDQLQRDATTLVYGLLRNDLSAPLSLDAFVDGASTTFNTRVVLYQVIGPPVALAVLADSAPVSTAAIERDATAVDAARTNRVQRGRVERGGREYAEVAVPLLPSGWVMLLSASLADQLATVELVERQLLYATLAALAVTLGLGAVAAAVHARRIRRLERAANRIAEGQFDEPVVDLGEDELGQLARAFERMRVQLSQLDAARKEFVANASHELRTPLFSLGGFLELLADEDLDEETRRGFLQTMREQVDRLTSLATDLLDLSRMDAGRIRIECEEVDLAEVGRTLGEELSLLADASGHRLEVWAQEGVWAVGDEERILQVGRALARNALVHTPRGTRVAIRSVRWGDRAALSVEDDGPGIAGEHAERIFDRFYRIEGGQASGSGLGLAIARELAGRMGGTVTVRSRAGTTTFTLELAAAPVPDRSGQLARVG